MRSNESFSQLAKEPLLHFLVLGLLIYGGYAWLRADDAPDDRQTITVGVGELAWLQTSFESRWKRAPTEAELDGLVDDYPARARHVAEELQNAELLIFPGVGHNPVFEIPDQYHGEMVRFLRSDPEEPADQGWVDTDVGVRR